MVEYSDRLKAAMELRGVKVAALATQLGMSYQGAKKAVDGRSKAFSAENNSKAAMWLGVSPDWLATGRGEMLQRTTSDQAVAVAPSASGAITLAQALEVVAASLNELPDARRELAAQHLQTLARAPDSAKAMQSAIEAISTNATGQVAKVLSMKLTKESANLFKQEVQ